MTILWSNQYCPSNDPEALAQALRDSLSALGYTLYNPFGMIPGKAYRQSVKAFVSPASGGWVRVMGALDEPILLQVSQSVLCLSVTLEGDDAHIRAYVNGQPSDTGIAVMPYLREGKTPLDLQKVLSGDVEAPLEIVKPAKQDGLPFNALPDDVQAMAKQVDPAQAQRLFSRLSGDVLKKVSKDRGTADEARALISGEGQPNWDSAGGRQIRALMACLTVPENWREPDFEALRDAYPLYERRKRNPTARAYPGDDAAMAQVPNALDFIPVYGGKME